MDASGEHDPDAELMGLITGGGTAGPGRTSGAAGGLSWQLKQVARQVAREIKADGTAETIAAVRAEQSELREALQQTQADLASALEEFRGMASRMQDQQRARMIVARSSSVDSRHRHLPAPPPRSGSARTADSPTFDGSPRAAMTADVMHAGQIPSRPGDAGVEGVARQLKQQLSASQLRELLARLEADEGAAVRRK